MDKSAPWGPDATELQDIFGQLGIAQDIAKGTNPPTQTVRLTPSTDTWWLYIKRYLTKTICNIEYISIEYLIKEVTFNWGQTQFDTTIDQLNHGIRYLDYRDPLF